MNRKPITRGRVLVSVATVLTAGALAVGSGATFVAASQNPGNHYTAGTLTQSNSLDGASIYNLSNLKPGDTVNGKVTITNSGSLAGKISLSESGVVNGFSQPTKLRMTITDVTVPATPVVVKNDVAYGTVGTVDLGLWASGEAHTYVFSVSLALDADNTNQGDDATATYGWNTTQDTTVTVANQHY